MFESIQAAFTEWGLIALAALCFAGAVAAFIYIPVIGQWIAVVLIALGSAFGAYDFGYSARGDLDNSGATQAQLDEANRELSDTRTVAADANAAVLAAAAFNQSQQDKINAYETKLRAAPPSAGCALSDDDVRSLSNIGAGSTPLPPRRPASLRPAGQAPGPR